MLIEVIKQYLTTERRLVVPRLGVFLTREDQTIVFSELMRRDDGVLRRLLVEAGMNELVAVGAIDRLIFEVHQAIEEGSSYTMEGFGCFSGGPNGTICFVYDLNAAQEQPVVAERQKKPRPAAVAPTAEPSVAPVEQAPQAAPQEPVNEPAAVENAPADAIAEPMLTEQSDDHYTAAEDEAYEEEYDEEEDFESQPHQRRSTRRRHAAGRKPDRFVLFALIAVLLALAAIAFGYYHEWSEAQAAEQSVLQLEQALSPTDGDEAQGEMNPAN